MMNEKNSKHISRTNWEALDATDAVSCVTDCVIAVLQPYYTDSESAEYSADFRHQRLYPLKIFRIKRWLWLSCVINGRGHSCFAIDSF